MKSKFWMCILLSLLFFKISPAEPGMAGSEMIECLASGSLLAGPSFKPLMHPFDRPLELTEEKCFGIPGVCKVCGSYVIEKTVAKLCGSVCGQKACMPLYQVGCLNLNATTQVANLKMCAENFKTGTKNNTYSLQMDIKARACTKIWKWEKCWTFWEKHVSYSYKLD